MLHNLVLFVAVCQSLKVEMEKFLIKKGKTTESIIAGPELFPI
jgi:hypothetical protein